MAKTEGVEHPPEEKEANRGSVAAAAWAAAAKARGGGKGARGPRAAEASARGPARSLGKRSPSSVAGRRRRMIRGRCPFILYISLLLDFLSEHVLLWQ